MEASKKRVRSFSQQELTFFREGRKAAREGFSLSSNRDSENPYFVRGFNQERLLIRSEAGEILLVRGMPWCVRGAVNCISITCRDARAGTLKRLKHLLPG